MPNRIKAVELTLRASALVIRAAVDNMTAQISILHDIARTYRGETAREARKYADRIAGNVKDIHNCLHELEELLRHDSTH